MRHTTIVIAGLLLTLLPSLALAQTATPTTTATPEATATPDTTATPEPPQEEYWLGPLVEFDYNATQRNQYTALPTGETIVIPEANEVAGIYLQIDPMTGYSGITTIELSGFSTGQIFGAGAGAGSEHCRNGWESFNDACDLMRPDAPKEEIGRYGYTYDDEAGTRGINARNERLSPDSGTLTGRVQFIFYGVPLKADFDATPAEGEAPLAVTFTDKSIRAEDIDRWEWDMGDGSALVTTTSADTQKEPPPHTYSTAGTYTATLTVYNDSLGISDTATQAITVLGIYRPFRQPVEGDIASHHEDPENTNGGNTFAPVMASWKDESIYAFSDSKADFVHSPEAAQVWSIRNFILDDCHPSSTTATGCLIPGMPSGDPEITIEDDIHIVELLTIDNRRYQYLVRNAYDYLGDGIGTMITGGCVIGEALEISGISNGMTIFRATNFETSAPIAIRGELNRYATNDEPCIPVDQDFETCLNAEPFTTSDLWQRSRGAQEAPEIGVSLPPGESISQTLSGLLNNQYYTVSVQGRGAGNLEVSLGDSGQIVPFNSTYPNWDNNRVQLSPTPDGEESTLYPLRLRASAENTENLEIWFSCLSLEDFEIGPSSPGCFFSNPDFGAGGHGWAINNPIGFEEQKAMLGHGGYVSQGVTIYPVTEGVDLTYEYLIQYELLEEPTGIVNELLVTYDSPAGEVLDLHALLSTADAGAGGDGSIPGFAPNVRRLTGEITINTATTTDFTVTAEFYNSSTQPETAARVAVTLVCLVQPLESGYPGYEDTRPDAEQDAPVCHTYRLPPFTFLSEPLEYLRTLGDYISGKMSNLVNCVIAPLLRGIIDSAAEMEAIMQSAWAFAQAHMAAHIGFWIDVIQMLGGFLGNLFNHPGLRSFVTALWGFLWGAIKVGWAITTFLWDTLWAILQIIFLVIFNAGKLAEMWNTAPALLPPGMPDCLAEPEAPFCLSLWIMNHTFLKEGSYGNAAVYLITAFGGIHLMIFTIRRVAASASRVARDTNV